MKNKILLCFYRDWGARVAHQLISDLNRRDLTVVLVEHRLDLVSKDASRIVLMDKGSITVTEGVVDIETVEAAIDATLEGRDYLKAKATNNRTPGSPPSKKMLPQQQTTPESVKYNKNSSM